MARPKRNPTLPNTAGEKCLRALGIYRYLTAEQATIAIGHAPTSVKAVYAALKHLEDHEYLSKIYLPRRTGRGISANKAVWTLAGRGRRWLADRGIEHPPRVAHSPEREILFLEHALAVNDVLIACERFAAKYPDHVRINALTPDHALKHKPIPVDLGPGRRVQIVPDGLVEMNAFGFEYCLSFEIDRGTEEGKKWKAKIEAILRYAETQRESPFMVAVVTTAGNHRLNQLYDWTGQQLTAMDMPRWSDLFRLTDRSAVELQPTDFFLDNIWVRPFDDQLYPLIEGGAA